MVGRPEDYFGQMQPIRNRPPTADDSEIINDPPKGGTAPKGDRNRTRANEKDSFPDNSYPWHNRGRGFV